MLQLLVISGKLVTLLPLEHIIYNKGLQNLS